MEAKKIPYGITNFARIQKENYYYVDKTRYIPLIEQAAPYFFLIRPRRFGKSLLINMLTWYYDINRKDSFKEVFAGCDIVDKPTSMQGQFLILSFNFSDVNPQPDKVLESFEQHCSFRFQAFADSYGHLFEPGFNDELMGQPSADAKLAYIIAEATTLNLPIYLFIDEYDYFANDILVRKGLEDYKKLVDEYSFFQRFFVRLKVGATGDGAIKRIFITGSSPIVMNDTRCSFNIEVDMSEEPIFNDLIGFNVYELLEMLEYYDDKYMLFDSVDKVKDIITSWCGGYCFSEDELNERIYNPALTLYFLNYYLPHKEVPNQMVDWNVYSDYVGLRHFIHTNKISGIYQSVMEKVMVKGAVSTQIKADCPVEAFAQPWNFNSLLYYYGLLMPQAKKQGKLTLAIPNLTVRHEVNSLLIEIYRENDLFSVDHSKLSELVNEMAYGGYWHFIFHYFATELERQSRVRGFKDDEAHLKGFLLASLSMAKGYIIQPKYEEDKSYSALYMMPDLLHQPDIANSYIVYVKCALSEASIDDIDALRREAAIQLQRYAADPLVAETKGKTQLGLITLVFKGWELAVCEM